MVYVSLTLLLFLLVSFPTAAHAAGPWYASPTGASGNPCTLAQPCTIAAAIAKLTLGAGETIFLRGGTYAEAINTYVRGGTSWDNATTISAYQNEVPILSPTSGASVIHWGQCNASQVCQYIIFKKIVLDCARNNPAYGMSSTKGFDHHMRFDGIEMRNCYRSGFSGLGFNSEVINSNIHHNGGNHLSHNFYICSHDSTIRDNLIWGSKGYGIQIQDSATPGCSSNAKIYNNKIYDNGGSDCDGPPATPCGSAGGMVFGAGDNVQVYNNLFYGNKVGPAVQLTSGGSINSNHKIFNNTIANNEGVGITIGSAIQSAEIRNNIIYQNGSQITNSSTGTITFSNNWCGGTGLGCTATMTGNPLFVGTGTHPYQLQAGSTARDKGTALVASVVTSDFLYLARPQPVGGAYDPGAYEYPVGTITPPNANTIYLKKPPAGSDSNDCFAAENESTPKATLAGASGALQCMTVAGKHLVIADATATYDEVIDSSALVGGSNAATPTMIEGKPGSSITLRMQGFGVGLAARTSYLTFRNLTVDCNNVLNTNGAAVFSGAQGITFDQITVHHCGYEGFFFQGSTTVLVNGGRSYSNTSHGLGSNGTISGLTIQDMIVDTNGGSGIAVPLGSGTQTNLVLNRNVIHHNGAYGIDLGTSTGTVVQNNILYRNANGLRIKSGVTQANVYQNTIANHTSGIGFECGAGATSINLRNNIVWGNGTEVVNTCGALDSHNVTTNPTFVDSAGDNYTLGTGSVAYNAGENLPSVTMDQLGVPRPQMTFWDAGALESTTDLGGGGALPDVTVLGRLAFAPLFFF